MSTEDPQVHEVAVLGAGIGGLGLAARLRREGEDDVVLLEKAERVGGTWRDNSYPGASCDVQSHLYWYSWDAPRDWTRVYAMQPEIQANVEEFAQRDGLLEKVRLGTEVVSAVWQDDVGHWLIRTADGAELRARSFVGAWGQLNRPTFRGINGRETFRGDSWHSARWRHDVDLRGKRVACIGNGASAVQFVPEVAEVAAHLTVFQKSPNYVVPRLDRFYEDEERRSFLDDPQAYLASRTGYYEEHESWMGAMKLESNPVLEEFYRVAREHLETQVPDPALREKLWPDYPLACKRILIADTYYPALVRDDVDLVTEQIARIEPEGVRTVDGTLHEVDVIVYATGFETLSFLGDLDVRGRGGRSLREAWQDGPEAYLGITVHGFPNLYLLYGPNTNLGHNSIIAMLECQYEYVLQALRAADEAGGRAGRAALDVREEVQRAYNEWLQEELRGTSFAGGCNSWYKTADGRITNNWSGSVEDYKARTASLDLSDYEVLTPHRLGAPA